MAVGLARFTSSQLLRLQQQEEYLQLRQKFKEEARRKMKEEQEAGVMFSTAQIPASTTETFGTFFGPSQPCISRRVIRESKAFMEEQLTKKPQNLPPEPAVTMDVKLKVQTLKKNRDYSCLLSEKDSSQALSPPSGETPSRAHVVQTKKTGPTGGDNGLSTLESRKSSSTMAVPEPNRSPPLTGAKKPALIGSKKVAAHRQKPPLPKLPQTSGQKRDFTEPGKVKLKQIATMRAYLPKEIRPAEDRKSDVRTITSTSISKPPQSSGQKRKLMEADNVTKLKPLAPDRQRKIRTAEDGEGGSRAISMIIRSLFRYDPNKYARMDSDDRSMETSFHDILKEENRSAKLAREEDKREQLLLEEEEKRERLRKDAKRREVT